MAEIIRNYYKRLWVILLSTITIVAGVYAAVFVDLTVDPPEVLSEWPCVSDCYRDASGVSFAVDDTSLDLDFFFVGLPDDAPISYALSSCGVILTTGTGTSVPLRLVRLLITLNFSRPMNR